MARKRPTPQSPTQPAQAESSSLLLWIRPGCLFLLGALICWSLLQPLDSTSVFDGSALPQDLGYLLLAVGVSLDLTLNQRRNRLTTIEACCLIGISVWILIGTFQAAGMSNPRTGWNGFWHLLSVFTLYFAMRNLLVGPKLRSTAMLVLLGGATVLAVLGVFQVTVDFPQARAEFRANPEKLIAQLGIEAPEGSPMRQKLDDRLNSPEPLATFALANSLAVLLSGCLVLSLGALGFSLLGQLSLEQAEVAREPIKTSGRIRDSRSNSQKLSFFSRPALLLMVMVGVVGCVWFLTRSRIAFLAVPFSLMLLACGAYWQWGKQLTEACPPATKRLIKQLLIGMAAVAVAGFVWLGWTDPLVFTEAGKSLSYRVDYWIATVSLLKDHWLLGVGLGNFQTFYPQYMLASASETIADPHNWILDIASTCSLPVAIIIVLGLAGSLIRKPAALPDDPLDNAASASTLALGAAIGGLIVLLGLAVFGLDGQTAAVLFTAMLVASTLSYGLRSMIESFASQTTLGPALMAVAMLICLLVSGSWQASGLIVPLVCCLTASRVDCTNAKSSAATRSRWGAQIPLLLSLLALVVFLWQSWSPVLQSNLEANRAMTVASGKLERIDRARQIDPYNSQWDRLRAQLLVDKAITLRELPAFQAAAQLAIEALDEWAKREPNTFLTGQFAGDRVLQLVEQADRLGLDSLMWRRQAMEYYAQAVQNRPTSVQLRVQLAYSLFIIAEKAEAAAEIAEAVALSDNTPHEDQKLKSQLVWIPGAPAELPILKTSEPYCPAELVVAWIRKQLDP